jgi:hypothetical protein
LKEAFYGGNRVIQSYQKKFIGKAKKDFNRLPAAIKATVMGYVSRGFWFLEVLSDRKTFWLIKMAQYHFLEDEKQKGKANQNGWVHEGIYKVSIKGEAKLARSTTMMPDGKEIYRDIIKL